MGKKESLFISAALERRMRGEPIQYILGKTEFMGFRFNLREGVFIPRPETEILVEAALNAAEVLSGRLKRSLEILDIGTGCGCIAVSLAKLLGQAEITAVDISPQAIETARENAVLSNVSGKVRFIQGDLFTGCKLQATGYDIIVSNPPYVPTSQIKKLTPEVRYEPQAALDGGRRGLEFYRRIIAGAGAYLSGSGFLILEIGFKQANAVKNIFQKSGEFEIIKAVRDYRGIERVIVAQKKER